MSVVSIWSVKQHRLSVAFVQKILTSWSDSEWQQALALPVIVMGKQPTAILVTGCKDVRIWGVSSSLAATFDKYLQIRV
jgi:hypothetical protein